MRHVKALAIKFISSLVLLSVILGLFFDMNFGNIFLISLVLGVVSYVIGDLFILPRTNNTVATLADFGLSLFVIWMMTEGLTYGDNQFTASLLAALGVTLFEYLFHRYVRTNVLDHNEENRRVQGNLQYQTEASEELTPVRPDVRSERGDENP